MKARTTMLVAALAVALAGCGAEAGSGGGSSGSGGETVGASEKTYDPKIVPAEFGGKVDNPYMPLEPGTTLVYEAKTDEGTERNTVTTTSDTKRVMGVRCVVVRDRVFLNGSLAEDTLDWFAQDKRGNVWYFGEDTKELKDGKVENTKGSWEAGVDGAKPGIVMQADPKVGQTYRQEYYKGEAEDMAKILAVDESATVPQGTYDNLLMTRDWNPIDPAAGVEQKYYAKGIGNVLEVGVKGTSERVELVDIQRG